MEEKRYIYSNKIYDVVYDFINNEIIINNNIFKVSSDRKNEYIYKFLKTKIKAKNGLKGIYTFLEDDYDIYLKTDFCGYGQAFLNKAIELGKDEKRITEEIK